LGNNIEQNCKHLQRDPSVRASIKTNQAKCKRGAVATVLTLLPNIYYLLMTEDESYSTSSGITTFSIIKFTIITHSIMIFTIITLSIIISKT
jgi:hypothetical protein